jgi:hypothetical protein
VYEPPARRAYASESGIDNLFFKNVYCLRGLGIVRKNRRIPKYFMERPCLFQDELIVFISISVLSLRSFNHEFTRFEKKHYPWSDLTKKNTLPLK